MNRMLAILRKSVANLYASGLPGAFATLMTALGLFGLGALAVVLLNLHQIAETIGRSSSAVAFLRTQSAAEAEELRAQIAAVDGVDDTRLLSPDDAWERVRNALGEVGKELRDTSGVPMPWSVVFTSSGDPATSVQEVASRVAKIPAVDEIRHPGADLSRIEAVLLLLRWAAVFLVVLISLAVVIVVSGAIRLTLFSRRDEIEIMKLVGATDLFVRVPFLVEGGLQGLGGGLLGWVGLLAAQGTLIGLLRLALAGGTSVDVVTLPFFFGALLVFTGMTLGIVGAAVSIGRFLKV